MPKPQKLLPLRIVVIEPPPGVVFAIQHGRDELSGVTLADGSDLSFDLSARVGDEKEPNFLGPFVQGPKGGRFVYVNSGTLAGQKDSPWERRAKVSLQGITRKMIKDLEKLANGILEARIFGRAKDGGPCCASVPILHDGWRVVSD